MANHCIDVICLNCGRSWCLRCANLHEAQPNRGHLKSFLKNAVRRAATQYKGRLDHAIYLVQNESCACGDWRVAMC